MKKQFTPPQRLKVAKPTRYRWNKQCVCGAFLSRPAADAKRITCMKCGQEHEVSK